MSVLIVTSESKRAGRDKAAELADWLADKGVRSHVVMSESIIVDNVFSAEVDEAASDADLIFSLGGDGTFLSSAQVAFRHPAPILGFNFGTLGFLTGASPDSVFEGAAAALAGELKSETRCALDVSITDSSGDMAQFRVLNEVAVTRGNSGKMIPYEVRIDGDFFSRMMSDGVIVSSSTGSTAYSLSAGGPIISPKLSCMVVVSLAPHSLVSRAFVASEEEEVCILPEQGYDADCTVFLDGHPHYRDSAPSKIVATVCADAIELLTYDAPGFARAASKVFYGGMDA